MRLSNTLVLSGFLLLPQVLSNPINFDRFKQLPLLKDNVIDTLLQYAGYNNEDLKSNYEIIDTWKSLASEYSIKDLKTKIDQFNNKLFTPKSKVQDIFNKENKDSYEIVSNDSKYEGYQLRINKNDPKQLGIDTVDQFSGYLDFKDKHFFYYFFESRNNPLTDPIILWLNGGPGCSSMTGLFFELGPSSIGPDIKPVYNPFSWNSNASVIFLEQPIGVGFSYGDEKISSTYAAAKDVFIFLELFFQKFPHYTQNKFHIAGESYAGHYIPNIASEIINHADRSFELASVLIGNGITDSLIQDEYYQPMACGLGGYPKVLTDEACDGMEKAYPRCARLVKACYSTQNAFTCVPATVYCSNKLLGPFEKTGLNYYDIRIPCETDNGLCYKGLDYVEEYLNKPEVQLALGSEVDHFEGCNDDVFSSFALTGDESKPFQYYVAELLNKGYPVLIYAGDKDFICNWLGNHAWTDNLDWILADSYREEYLKPWFGGVNQTQAGEIKSFGGLTFLRVFDAGHMVPYDQPEASLNFVNSWINGTLV